MIHIGQVQTALCVSALEAVLGATRPPEMKLPIKWPNAPTGDIVIELQETVFAKRVEIWHFLMVQLVRGLLVQMIAMVMGRVQTCFI